MVLVTAKGHRHSVSRGCMDEQTCHVVCMWREREERRGWGFPEEEILDESIPNWRGL